MNAQTLEQKQTKDSHSAPVNRREFLYYLGGAGITLFSAMLCGRLYQYAMGTMTVIPEGEPSVFRLDAALLQSTDMPLIFAEARSFLVLNDTGLVAFSPVCPWIRCFLKWVYVFNSFVCPCHGCKYDLDGTRISGLARRNMDRYTIWVDTPAGVLRTPADGAPVPIDNATRIFIDTGRVIRGQPIVSRFPPA